MKRAVLVFLAVLALVAVGCSSKKSSNKSGDATTTTKAESQSLSSDERDQIAGDALVTTEDLPGRGWEKTPSDSSSNSPDDNIFGSVAECKMFANRDKPPTEQAVSFSGPMANGVDLQASEQVGVWKNSDDASNAIALFVDNEADLSDCLQAGLLAVFEDQGVTGAKVDVDAFDVNQGDESVGFKATLSARGESADMEFAVVRSGPAGATVFTFGMDQSDSDEVIATATDKLEQAVAG